MPRGGYLYKRGKIWWGRVQHKGDRHEESLGTENKAAARDRLAKWVARKQAENWGEKPRRSLNEAIDQFAAKHFRKLKPSSVTRYLVSIERLTEHFNLLDETLFLDDIGSARLIGFEEARLADGVKPSSVRRDLACLSSIFSRAEEWEWITHNPVKPFLRGRKSQGLREGEARQRYLSHEEELAVLNNAAPKALRAITFAIDTGLRKEEQFSLLRTDVDLHKHEITIRPEHAKSGRGRKVPILPRTVTMLKEMFAERLSRYVFTTYAGNRYSQKSPTMYEALQKAVRRAGITEHVEWHDLRRTCGCRLLQDYGMSMEKVSHWLGHSSIKVTETRYAFLKIDDLHTAIRNRPDNVVSLPVSKQGQ